MTWSNRKSLPLAGFTAQVPNIPNILNSSIVGYYTGGPTYNDRCCNRQEKVRSAIRYPNIVNVAL